MKEQIYFKSSDGTRLCGILSNPLPGSGNPIVILCHGFSTHKDGRTNTRLEVTFNNNGLATFRFDFFGHGESGGKLEDITISEAVDDVLQAIKFAQQTGHKKIGLVGSSFGGMAGILAASKSSDLSVLALKSPVSDYLDKLIFQDHKKKIEEWKEKGFIQITGAAGQNLRLNHSFYLDAQRIKGYEAAVRIFIPTLIVHGNKDETVPVEQSLKASKIIKNCRLEILDGADHIYSQPPHFEKMLEFISSFVIEHTMNNGRRDQLNTT
jgi:pimeloyl-ACP methyl ester carboxylesterase